MSSPYYPLNFYLSRPYVRKCFKDFESYRAGLDPQVSQRIVMDHLVPWLILQGWDPQDPQSEAAIAAQEMQGVLAWGDWAMNGKRIFSIKESLAHAFEHSNVSDMHIADVLPEDGPLYLNFEGTLQEPIALDDNTFFEGAYVLYAKGVSTRIVLCARMPGGYTALVRWRERYDLRIPAKYLNSSADEAIDFALADDLEDLRNAGVLLAERGERRGGKSVAMLTQRMAQGHAAYKKALRLILNALAFIKGYPMDRRDAWPEKTPARLLNQATRGTAKEQARGVSKLWELGFVPVTYLGESFAQTLIRTTCSPEMRVHWRRGHWRNQPHGPAFSLRKLIWLQPVIVGAGE
jgi:hypothetical protein